MSDAATSERFRLAGLALALSVDELRLELSEAVYKRHKEVVDEYLAALRDWARAVLAREDKP